MTRRAGRSFAPWTIALLAPIVALTGCAALRPPDATDTPANEATVIVSELSETTMHALPVEPPEQERWRDIADVAYRDDFREGFNYANTARHRVEVRYEPAAEMLQGVVSATGLKPSMAYQLKLVGLEPIAGATEAENAGDARRWSSWQLGRSGRWWCEDCDWNVPDADLASHVGDGHTVRGYLLFDWFVTDARGDAQHPFALDTSLHVLWRVGQRERGANDSPPRWYTVERPADVYPPSAADTKQQIGLFGEWEPDRPQIGHVRLPAGSYEVGLNLTEETFHANLGEARALEGGGLWAWVLQSELRFEVQPDGSAVPQHAR